MKPDRSVLLSGKVLAVAAMLALAATAITSCGRSTAARDELSRGGSASYPASHAVPLESGALEAATLDKALETSALGRYLARLASAGKDSSAQALLRRPHRWSAVGLPPALAKHVMGARLYLLRGIGPKQATPGCGYSTVHEFVAVKDGRLYSLPLDFCQLLVDCGGRFRREDVAAWTPLAAYVAVATGKYPPSHVKGTDFWHHVWDSVSCGQAPLVAALAIARMRTDTVKTMSFGQMVLPGDAQEVGIEVEIAGRTDTFVIPIVRSQGWLFPTGVRSREFGGDCEFQVPPLSMLDEGTPSICTPPNEPARLGKPRG